MCIGLLDLYSVYVCVCSAHKPFVAHNRQYVIDPNRYYICVATIQWATKNWISWIIIRVEQFVWQTYVARVVRPEIFSIFLNFLSIKFTKHRFRQFSCQFFAVDGLFERCKTNVNCLIFFSKWRLTCVCYAIFFCVSLLVHYSNRSHRLNCALVFSLLYFRKWNVIWAFNDTKKNMG